MAAIIDGVGVPRATVGRTDRRASERPAQAEGLAGDRAEHTPPDRRTALGRLFAERGGQRAQAVHARQFGRRLNRLQDRAEEARRNLELVKLYPPYPLDEPKRAAAIRQFNGVAEEVARIIGHERVPSPLEIEASTETVEAAVNGLQQAEAAIAQRRAALIDEIGALASVEAEHAATVESVSIGEQLAAQAAGLAHEGADVLRQLA